ncbi:hypothetical protein EVAR_21420_1 [Eumeta japonica]|uniref:Uncharacterized protein n=1 Tax=Eumeta variegata TaxID=151549 RepID=A0A4C1VJK2_EUMVA|nr:hypothetical protein EVAR_21420_1 [Eumeta japonica]
MKRSFGHTPRPRFERAGGARAGARATGVTRLVTLCSIYTERECVLNKGPFSASRDSSAARYDKKALYLRALVRPEVSLRKHGTARAATPDGDRQNMTKGFRVAVINWTWQRETATHHVDRAEDLVGDHCACYTNFTSSPWRCSNVGPRLYTRLRVHVEGHPYTGYDSAPTTRSSTNYYRYVLLVSRRVEGAAFGTDTFKESSSQHIKLRQRRHRTRLLNKNNRTPFSKSGHLKKMVRISRLRPVSSSGIVPRGALCARARRRRRLYRWFQNKGTSTRRGRYPTKQLGDALGRTEWPGRAARRPPPAHRPPLPMTLTFPPSSFKSEPIFVAKSDLKTERRGESRTREGSARPRTRSRPGLKRGGSGRKWVRASPRSKTNGGRNLNQNRDQDRNRESVISRYDVRICQRGSVKARPEDQGREEVERACPETLLRTRLATLTLLRIKKYMRARASRRVRL